MEEVVDEKAWGGFLKVELENTAVEV